MTTRQTIALTRWTFISKVMSLLFNTLSSIVIDLIPRNKCLLISWLQSPSTMILEPKKIVCHCFHCFPIYLLWSDRTGCHSFCFLNVEFFTLSLSSFTCIKRLFTSSSLFAIRVCHLHIWGYWYFSWKSWFQLELHPAQHITYVFCI